MTFCCSSVHVTPISLPPPLQMLSRSPHLQTVSVCGIHNLESSGQNRRSPDMDSMCRHYGFPSHMEQLPHCRVNIDSRTISDFFLYISIQKFEILSHLPQKNLFEVFPLSYKTMAMRSYVAVQILGSHPCQSMTRPFIFSFLKISGSSSSRSSSIVFLKHRIFDIVIKNSCRSYLTVRMFSLFCLHGGIHIHDQLQSEVHNKYSPGQMRYFRSCSL